MPSYSCPNCGEIHKYSTLLEFPQPEIISRISRGENNSNLKVLDKNFFVIDRSLLVCQGEIEIPILDYDDSFEMLIWLQVDGIKLKKLVQESNKNLPIAIDGKMLHPIPFYDNSENLNLQVAIDFFSNHNPKVTSILNHEELNRNIQEGLKLEELHSMFSNICEMVNNADN